MTTTTPHGMTHLVTLNVTPGWQPTTQGTGRTCEWWAMLATFRVETDYGVTQYGQWTTSEQAARFASSMGGYGNPRAVECAPYLYAPAFGKCDGYPARAVA